MLVDSLPDGCLVGATDLVELHTTLEELEGGHGLNTSFLSSLAVLVNINLHKGDISEFSIHGVNLGGNVLARRAPGGVEVNNDEIFGCDSFLEFVQGRKLLEATAETEHQVEGGLLLDVVVLKGAAVLELLSGEDQALLIRRDTFLVLDLGPIQMCVG